MRYHKTQRDLSQTQSPNGLVDVMSMNNALKTICISTHVFKIVLSYKDHFHFLDLAGIPPHIPLILDMLVSPAQSHWSE